MAYFEIRKDANGNVTDLSAIPDEDVTILTDDDGEVTGYSVDLGVVTEDDEDGPYDE